MLCTLFVVGHHVLSVEYGGSSDSTLLDVLRSECTVRYVSGVDVCRVSLSELFNIRRPSSKHAGPGWGSEEPETGSEEPSWLFRFAAFSEMVSGDQQRRWVWSQEKRNEFAC